jgi:hypothetical protein
VGESEAQFRVRAPPLRRPVRCQMCFDLLAAPEPRQHSCGRCGAARARSHCRFVPSLIPSAPDSRTYSEPLFLKRQCDRTLGAALYCSAACQRADVDHAHECQAEG